MEGQRGEEHDMQPVGDDAAGAGHAGGDGGEDENAFESLAENEYADMRWLWCALATGSGAPWATIPCQTEIGDDKKRSERAGPHNTDSV